MSTLVERLEALAAREGVCGQSDVRRLAFLEAAAALRATTGEGEWPDDAAVERALKAPYGNFSVSSFIPLKSPDNIRNLMRAALVAAAKEGSRE